MNKIVIKVLKEGKETLQWIPATATSRGHWPCATFSQLVTEAAFSKSLPLAQSLPCVGEAHPGQGLFSFTPNGSSPHFK